MTLTNSNDLMAHFAFKNRSEKQQFFAEQLQIRFLSLVEEEMEKQKISKKQLADQLGVSKSYVSQMFAADTLLNFRTLGKMEDMLGIQFDISIKHKANTNLN